MRTETSTLWACVDCLMFEANGDLPSASVTSFMDMDENGHTEEDRKIIAGFEQFEPGVVTLGIMFGEDGCSHTSDSYPENADEHSEGCETQTFSYSPCDVCHSPLGGSRHALTYWNPIDIDELVSV